jgi:hypothetical protein
MAKEHAVLVRMTPRRAMEMLMTVKAGASCCVYDEDIPSIDTPAAPTSEQIQGPITRASAKQLNYHVLSYLATLSYIHENMMLPK